jgi:tetratricopeptide (TPR) repeat protein
LTLEELGDASGVSARAISDMERGHSRGPQARTMEAIASALMLGDADRSLLLAAARAGRRRPVGPAAGPCDLPPDIPDFAGRADHVAWLTRPADSEHNGLPVSVVCGAPGLGKTALAVHSAHRIAGEFRDGCFLLDLRGLDVEPVDSAHALFRLLKALGVREQAIPPDPQERRVLYLRLMQEKHVLVVLDNAAYESQVRPLLPGPGQSAVWITSRRTMTGIEHCRRLSLPPLSPDDSALMLTAIVGTRGEAGKDDGDAQVAELAQLCGHLPLALRIAGNRLLSQPAWTVRTFTDRLAGAEGRLDRLSAGDLYVEAAFALSYEQLSPVARRLFRRLALAPGIDVAPTHGAVLTRAPIPEVEETMDELVELGLLIPTTGDRCAFHDLLRLYAGKRLQAEETAADRDEARSRLYDWLLNTATAAGQWFGPDAGRPADSGPDLLVDLADRDTAMRWLVEENLNWLAAYYAAAEAGEHRRVLATAEALHWFADHWIFWGHWPEFYALARSAAHDVGDRHAEAAHLNDLAWAQDMCQKLPAEALVTALAAAALAREIGDRVQEAWAWAAAAAAAAEANIGGPAEDDERVENAMVYGERAYALFRELDDKVGAPQALLVVCRCLTMLGRTAESLDRLARVVDLVTDPATAPAPHIASMNLNVALSFIGEAHTRAGDWASAEQAYRKALDATSANTTPTVTANIMSGLAEALHHLGRHTEARAPLQKALDLYTDANDATRAARERRKLEEWSAGD